MNLADLVGLHRGADIYVIGSGASLNHMDPSYFYGRIAIGINWVAERWPVSVPYTLTKYHDCALALTRKYPDMLVVVSRHLFGNPHTNTISPDDELPNLVPFDSKPGQVPGTSFSVKRDWPDQPQHLVNSHSSITSAMHLAALMGAANILLVGHDCDLTDGKMHFDGYRPTPDTHTTVEWLQGFERHSREVKAELIRRYGCRIYSVSPFINHHREGH